MKITVIATGFDEESNKSYDQRNSKVNVRGTTVGLGAAPTPVEKPTGNNNPFSIQNKTSAAQAEAPKAVASDDLDVPAFLRNKK